MKSRAHIDDVDMMMMMTKMMMSVVLVMSTLGTRQRTRLRAGDGSD